MQLKPGMQAVVIGLGAAGLSVVRHLRRLGIRVAVSEKSSFDQIDTTTRAFLQQEEVRLETGGHTEAFLVGADFVVPGPGVPLTLPVLKAARALGLPIVGECALAANAFTVPVIAVTGANGKTTVTSLIGRLLQAAGKRPFVGGNIGTPLLDYFEKPDAYDMAVLELSSFQLDLAGEFRPDIGLLLNITPDHLDRHGSFEAYAAAKIRLFACQKPGDAAILGGDDPAVNAVRLNAGVGGYWFGRASHCEARINQGKVSIRLAGRGEAIYELAGTSLHSSVNQLNAAAAVLAATLCDCSEEAIKIGLAAFVPPPHRMAEVARIGGVRFINDSKATNIGALHAALAGCEERVVLIAGGRDKGSDYSLLADVVRDKVKHLVLIGEAAELMARALVKCVPVDFAGSMEDAVRKSMAAAASGDVVLLAPGCASYDMFSGYEERGRVFAASVLALGVEGK